MPEENQGQEPSQDQAQDTVFDVDGEQVPASELVNRYKSSRSEMNEVQRQRAEDQKLLQEYKSWADPIRESYNSDTAYREQFDAMYQERAAANPVDQTQQQLRHIETRLARQDQDQAFSDLAAQGHEITNEIKSRVLNEVETNPNVRDVKAAFFSVYGQELIAKARLEGSSSTADQLAENKGSYPVPPTGQQRPSPSKDVSKMTEAERDKEVMAQLKGLDYL